VRDNQRPHEPIVLAEASHPSCVIFVGDEPEAADPEAVSQPQKQTLGRGQGVAPL